MDLKTLLNWGSEIVFCLCGLVSFNAAWRGLQNEKCRIGTFVFWTILGLIFILGPYIPYALTGALLLVLGCLTATKQVLSLIHISEPTRQAEISYAVFCLKKKKKNT